jgi:hypothetical protein
MSPIKFALYRWPLAALFSVVPISLALAGLTVAVDAQDSSLVEVARQTRQKNNASPSSVIDNDTLPSHAARNPVAKVVPVSASKTMSPDAFEKAGEKWKDQIAAEKSKVAQLQLRINQVNETIRAANLGCSDNCVLPNPRLKSKVDEANSLKLELAEQQRQLEALQDSARKQGFGSAVYDP